jgi:hypothetical protein
MNRSRPEPYRIVGAAPAHPTATRLIETLYRTRIPETSVWAGAFFELTLGEETIDGQLGYFVRETECRRDPLPGYLVRVQYTLSPRGGFRTIEEAYERYQLQRMTRARLGFIHSYTPVYDAGQRHRYRCVEASAAAGAASLEPAS